MVIVDGEESSCPCQGGASASGTRTADPRGGMTKGSRWVRSGDPLVVLDVSLIVLWT
jgi:hypothetical protein